MRLNYNAEVCLSENIRSVTASGILYLDHDGQLGYVDFEECYHSWLEWELQLQDQYSLTDFEFHERIKEWKEVGSRDACDEPPFIIFYTEPQIQIEFKSYEEISAFRQRIYELGRWHTYDLT